MEVGALNLTLKAIGADAVKASLDRVSASFDKASVRAKAYDATMGSLKDAIGGFVAGATITAFLGKLVQETSAAQDATAQLAATLRSTGGAAGYSLSELKDFAGELQRVTTYGDDAIVSMMSLLGTFTEIRGPMFKDATRAVLDLATKLGGDLKGAALQVGKALQDPILGVGALSRAGVQFSEAQREVIRSLVETNRLVEAQALIMAELKKQTEGSAEAARNTLGGALKGLGNAFGELFEISDQNSKGIITAINNITNTLNDLDQWLSRTRIGEKFGLFIKGIAAALDPKQAAALAMAIAEFNAPFRGAGGGADWGDTDKTTQKVKSMIAMLVELAGLVPITTKQHAALQAEQQRLNQQLEGGNLSLERRLEIAKQLVDVEKALADATVKRTVAESEARMAGGAAGVGRTPSGGPGLKIDPKNIRATAQEIGALIDQEFQTHVISTAQALGEQLRQTLAASVGSAFEVLLTRGANVGDAFKAFGATMLRGLGDMVIMFGVQVMKIGALMTKTMASLMALNGPGALAAGLALVALGGMLRGAAGRAFSGVGAGSTPVVAGGGLGGLSGPMTLPGLTFGPTAAAAGPELNPRSNIAVTIIGPNDPQAQRQMQELLRNADRRGGITTV